MKIEIIISFCPALQCSPEVFFDLPASLWTFPSRRPVRPSSLCALSLRTGSRGKVASVKSSQCPAGRCPRKKRCTCFTLFQLLSVRVYLIFCWTSASLCFRRWSADEARILRVSVNSFLDHLSLILETMEMFGPPVSQWRITKDSGLFELLILCWSFHATSGGKAGRYCDDCKRKFEKLAASSSF